MTQTFDRTTQHNSVGRATRRQDAPDKLTGRTRYAGDVSVAGMLHARLVLSPYAHARILSIDTSAAEAVPGVQAVYTSETLGMAKRDTSSRTQSPLAQNVSDKAHYHGGDMDAGWREAEVVVERTYTTSFVHQSYIEPQSIMVEPSRSGHQLTIWPSSQGMFAVRSDVSEALKVPDRQVRVESVPIGGAFGGKFGLVEPLAAAAAFASRRPVRLALTRSEDLLAGNPAPQSVITVKLGAKRDGTLVASQAKVIFDTGAFAGSAVGTAGYLLGSVYRCPNFDFRCYEVLTNKVGVGAYRAPGAPQAAFALES